MKVIQIKDPCERWSFFSQCDFQETALIVSDIKTKTSIELHLLKQQKYLSDLSILRVNDFFKNIFYDLNKDWTLVSDSFLSQLFLEFSSNHSLPWVKNFKRSDIFLSHFKEFLPLLFHPQNSELLTEWIQKRENHTSVSWKHWYTLCQDFFEFIKQKKIIHESGLSSFVMSEMAQTSLSFSKSKIVVDLGVSLNPIDYSIFKEISSQKDITILIPFIEEKIFYKKEAQSIYQNFFQSVPQSRMEVPSSKSNHKPSFFKEKNETQLGEIKKATAQVRQWLDQGVQAQDIVLLSPDIEAYWAGLKIHLEKENIKVKKGDATKIVHFLPIQNWIARLHLHLGLSQFSQLEIYNFYKNVKKPFHQFYQNYFKMFYKPEKLNPILSKDKQRALSQSVKGREFIDWAISLLPQDNEDFLDFIFSSFKNFPLEFSLKWGSWLQLLDLELFELAKNLKEEDNQGISCLSLNAIDSVQGKFVFILGLDENSLKTTSFNSLNQKDSEQLMQDLGFTLFHSHPQEKDYKLLWFLQSSSLKEVVLSYSSYDIYGEILTPSLFYTLSSHLFQIESQKPTQLTVWDSQSQQKDALSSLSTKLEDKECTKRITNYFKPFAPYTPESPLRLSASQLSTYFECPFRYVVKYHFHKDEIIPLDREVTPRDFGSLVHRLFQNILETENLETAQKNLDKIILNLVQDISFTHKIQKDILQKELYSLSNQFIKFEQERSNKFPDVKPLLLEKEFEFYWNKKASSFDSQGDYKLKGKIDRIDYDKKNEVFWLIDYKKTKVVHLTNLRSWISDKSENLQLLIYGQALEKGCIPEASNKQVSALLYYSFSDFDYKGYTDKAYPYKELFKSSRSQVPVFREKLDEAVNKSCQRVKGHISSLERGDFEAKPFSVKTCEHCSWRSWCRAPHLH